MAAEGAKSVEILALVGGDETEDVGALPGVLSQSMEFLAGSDDRAFIAPIPTAHVLEMDAWKQINQELGGDRYVQAFIAAISPYVRQRGSVSLQELERLERQALTTPSPKKEVSTARMFQATTYSLHLLATAELLASIGAKPAWAVHSQQQFILGIQERGHSFFYSQRARQACMSPDTQAVFAKGSHNWLVTLSSVYRRENSLLREMIVEQGLQVVIHPERTRRAIVRIPFRNTAALELDNRSGAARSSLAINRIFDPGETPIPYHDQMIYQLTKSEDGLSPDQETTAFVSWLYDGHLRRQQIPKSERREMVLEQLPGPMPMADLQRRLRLSQFPRMTVKDVQNPYSN